MIIVRPTLNERYDSIRTAVRGLPTQTQYTASPLDTIHRQASQHRRRLRKKQLSPGCNHGSERRVELHRRRARAPARSLRKEKTDEVPDVCTVDGAHDGAHDDAAGRYDRLRGSVRRDGNGTIRIFQTCHGTYGHGRDVTTYTGQCLDECGDLISERFGKCLGAFGGGFIDML